MLEAMTPDQFMGWLDYHSVEPFGELRADLRAGAVCAVVANVNRDPTKRSEPYAPRDFMPYLEREARAAQERGAEGYVQTPEDRWRELKSDMVLRAQARLEMQKKAGEEN